MVLSMTRKDSETALFVSRDGFCDPSRSRVAHGFFGRGGGKSRGLYEGLNCGTGSADNPVNIAENRVIVADSMGFEADRLVGLYQVHGRDCVRVLTSSPWGNDDRPKADAMITDVSGVLLGILTADCAPVLFHGLKADGAPLIGAAHAGWRGAVAGVLESTVESMQKAGVLPETLRACIGPCIAQKSYEVSEDMIAQVMDGNPESERFFKSAGRTGHAMFDLPGYCAARLKDAGVGRVVLCDLDTYALERDYFSCRRASHRGEKDYGRQISVIGIRAVAS